MFLKLFLEIVWRLHGKSIPLHSLYETSRLADKGEATKEKSSLKRFT